jgi:hypothetical protein
LRDARRIGRRYVGLGEELEEVYGRRCAMKPPPAKVAAATLIAVAVGVGATAQSTSGDRDAIKFVYAVPVLCGFGRTSINVHNPNGRAVTFTKGVIPLDPGQNPKPPAETRTERLNSGWAFLRDCDDIAAAGGVGLSGMGNVTIRSTLELDVWAVRTSVVAGGGIGETRVMRVEPTTLSK